MRLNINRRVNVFYLQDALTRLYISHNVNKNHHLLPIIN